MLNDCICLDVLANDESLSPISDSTNQATKLTCATALPHLMTQDRQTAKPPRDLPSFQKKPPVDLGTQSMVLRKGNLLIIDVIYSIVCYLNLIQLEYITYKKLLSALAYIIIRYLSIKRQSISFSYPETFNCEIM